MSETETRLILHDRSTGATYTVPPLTAVVRGWMFPDLLQTRIREQKRAAWTQAFRTGAIAAGDLPDGVRLDAIKAWCKECWDRARESEWTSPTQMECEQYLDTAAGTAWLCWLALAPLHPHLNEAKVREMLAADKQAIDAAIGGTL